MTAAEKREIENRLGRRLSAREEIMERLDRDDNRSMEQRFDADKWQPTLEKPKGPATIFDQALLDAERQALESRLLSMPVEERRVLQLKQARAEALARQEAEATHVARMKSPEVARPLTALRDLRDRMRWDPAYGMAEVEAVDRAIQQYEEPGSDLQVARKLLDEALGFERSVKTAQRDAVLAKMRELGARQSELDSAISALNPKTDANVADDPLFDAWNTATEANTAAYEHWKILKADAATDPAALKEAREEWSGKLAAATAAREAYEATQGAESTANAGVEQ